MASEATRKIDWTRASPAVREGAVRRRADAGGCEQAAG